MPTLEEVAEDPQLKHRNMIVEIDNPAGGKVRQTGISIKLSETPGSIRNPGSAPGEDTHEVLSELGYSKDDIQRLVAEGVAGTEK